MNKYPMINVAMNMNEVIIWKINLLFNVKELPQEFAKIYIVFLIDFSFEYN